jgi:hypothetical protein
MLENIKKKYSKLGRGGSHSRRRIVSAKMPEV